MYEDLNVRISPGTSSHSVLTLSERGFKKLDAFQGYGDHFVHLQIKVPSHLTQEQTDLIKDYAYLEHDTPGTVHGIDRNRPRPSHRHRQPDSKISNENRNSDQTYPEYNYEASKKTESENQGFLAKLKRKLFG